MNPILLAGRLLIMVSILFLLGIACSSDLPVVVTVKDGGSITGKLCTSEGAPASGITVTLTPSDFNPLDADPSVTTVLAVTDVQGMYRFSTVTPGFFNISGHNDNAIAFTDSIYASTRTLIAVGTDTLKPAGSISGHALLGKGGDPTSIIILVCGTHSYTVPENGSGYFKINNLAEGIYHLRIFTIATGYGMIDTSITVTTGDTTTILDTFHLADKRLPEISAVTVRYDSLMMNVLLSWPALDTAAVSKIVIFRNTCMAAPPHAIIDKSSTMYIDDIFPLGRNGLEYGDTLRYRIAAQGADGKIGKDFTVPGIPVSSILSRGQSFTTIYDTPLGFSGEFAVDNHHAVFVSENGHIVKFDSSGQVLAEFRDEYSANDTDVIGYTDQLVTDNSGNVYYNYDREETPIYCLSNSLDSITRFPTVLSLSHPHLLVAPDRDTLYGVPKSPLSRGISIERIIPALQQHDFLHVTISIPPETFMPLTIHAGLLWFMQEQKIIYTVPLAADDGPAVLRFDIDTLIRKNFPDDLPCYLVDKLNFLPDGSFFVAINTFDYKILKNFVFLFFFTTEGELYARASMSGSRCTFDGVDRVYVTEYAVTEISCYTLEK